VGGFGFNHTAPHLFGFGLLAQGYRGLWLAPLGLPMFGMASWRGTCPYVSSSPEIFEESLAD
jgi:hypothetical protein